MNDGGKGSARRPAAISPEQVEESWQRIFGKKDVVTENNVTGEPLFIRSQELENTYAVQCSAEAQWPIVNDAINITPTKLKELLTEAHRVGFEQGEKYYCRYHHAGYTESAKAHWQCVEEAVTKIYNKLITANKES